MREHEPEVRVGDHVCRKCGVAIRWVGHWEHYNPIERKDIDG